MEYWFFVMAILKGDPSYGYKIVNDLNDYLSITESTLYPILRRLEAAGKLSTFNELFPGRNRKYYALTRDGEIELERFISEWDDIRKISIILSKKNNQKD
ncbi:MAG: PadR family transcriptional regulator [Acholeplasmatales bacterium]|jgi:PadR family transcriptional regulator PadR|nr:PadR family transcriptional regulator [Acholeplasmatales bacterium]